MKTGIEEYFSNIPSCLKLRGRVVSDTEVRAYTKGRDKTANAWIAATLLGPRLQALFG